MEHKSHKDLLTEQLLNEFMNLSEEYKEPMFWVVRNFVTLCEFIEMVDINMSDLDNKIEKAKAKSKPLIHILLCVKKTVMDETWEYNYDE